MKEILVAVDGSKHSERIVDYASELAKSIAAKIVTVYVVPEVKIPEEYKEYAKAEHIDPSRYYVAVGEQIISQMRRRIEKSGVEFEGIYEFGHPSSKIIEIANRRKVSVIVVGLHGLHGLGKLQALGSTARRVIENSSVPVVVVP